jgi:hypothetical protein
MPIDNLLGYLRYVLFHGPCGGSFNVEQERSYTKAEYYAGDGK